MLKDTLAVLWLVVLLSQSSQVGNNTVYADKYEDEYSLSCNTDRACPTWFICNTENNYECGDGHNNAVVCDDELKESAVLDCNCVNYDNQSQVTYLGQCFYNCQNSNPQKVMDYVIVIPW